MENWIVQSFNTVSCYSEFFCHYYYYFYPPMAFVRQLWNEMMNGMGKKLEILVWWAKAMDPEEWIQMSLKCCALRKVGGNPKIIICIRIYVLCYPMTDYECHCYYDCPFFVLTEFFAYEMIATFGPSITLCIPCMYMSTVYFHIHSLSYLYQFKSIPWKQLSLL